MVHIIIGGAGTGKSTRLIELLQECLRMNETSITLIPEQFSYEFDQKLYHALGASEFNRLQTYSFQSLARSVFERFGTMSDQMPYADELTKYALLYQAILDVSVRKHMLRYLEKQCQHPSFLEALEVLFSQFRQSGMAPDQLYQSCVNLQGRLREKIMDLFLIYQKYDMLLNTHQVKDTETYLSEAAAVANGQDAFLGDTLFIDEFESFTADEYRMLDVLFASCKDVYIALRTEELDAMPFSLFSTVNETMAHIMEIARRLHIPVEVEQCQTAYRFHGEDLQWLSQHIFRPCASTSCATDRLHLLEATSPNEEVDYVCTTIRRLLADNPTLRCRDIVVLTNQLHEYQSILETAMERYALPYHMDEKKSICYMPLMVYLQTLLAILQQKKPDTELLLRLGKSGLTSCSATEIAELENYCYFWQIDGSTWYAPFVGGDCEIVEGIRQKLLHPIQALHEKCSGTQNGGVLCEILYDFLEQEGIQEKLNEQLLTITDENKRMQQTEEWAFAWNSWVDILEHVAKLYRSFPMRMTELCAVLSSLVQHVKRAVPPRTLDAILIAQGSTARLNAPKIVFLLGLCEGSFPANATGSAIFSERDCEVLEQAKISVGPSKESQLADARLAAYKLLSAASDALYLLHPCVDSVQQKCYPSMVFAQIYQMFPNIKKQTCATLGSAYYATTYYAAYYQYVQDYTAHTVDTKSIEQVLLQDSFYRSRVKNLESITKQRKNDTDAPLFQIEQPKLVRQRMGKTLQLSASGLERYQLCPFSYFCKDMLGLRRRQKMQLAGAENGNLVHYCLEQIFKEYPHEVFLNLSEQTLYQSIEKHADTYWKIAMGGNFSKSGRELATYTHAVADMWQLLLHLQEEFRQSAFYPAYLELQISAQNPSFPPLELETAQGQSIRLVGKVDRVDLCQDGNDCWVRVVDYKTGAKDFSLGNLLYGMDLQMLIYLFTITAPNTALSHGNPAGVLYMPSGGIRSTLERGSDISPKKQYYDTYRMNGVLLQDPHLLTLMEQNGQGIYVPGKLNAAKKIDSKSGIFLTKKQMRHLRIYVLDALKHTADQIYSGAIDANPLMMQQRNACAYCDYANICGNVDHHHGRCVTDTANVREKQMLEYLEQDQEGENA